MGSEPTPRCCGALAPFRVGAGLPGPDPAPTAGRRCFMPLAVVAAPQHTPIGSLLMGKALPCAKARSPLLGCTFAGLTAAVVTARTSFSSARCSAGPLCHVSIQVTLCRDWPAASESALGRGPAHGRTGSGLQHSQDGFAGSRKPGLALLHSAGNCLNGLKNR